MTVIATWPASGQPGTTISTAEHSPPIPAPPTTAGGASPSTSAAKSSPARRAPGTGGSSPTRRASTGGGRAEISAKSRTGIGSTRASTPRKTRPRPMRKKTCPSSSGCTPPTNSLLLVDHLNMTYRNLGNANTLERSIFDGKPYRVIGEPHGRRTSAASRASQVRRERSRGTGAPGCHSLRVRGRRDRTPSRLPRGGAAALSSARMQKARPEFPSDRAF